MSNTITQYVTLESLLVRLEDNSPMAESIRSEMDTLWYALTDAERQALNERYVFRGQALPEHLRESLDAYVELGRPTGSFLQAVIDNNLREACGRADEQNLPLIPVIVAFLYNRCPLVCWGFDGAHDAWVERKRKERARD